jgi:death on curing protein
MTERAEPRWLREEVILALHHRQLIEHGGAPGLRDPALLDSALARPRHAATYGAEADLASLAAAYAFGLARNHPFVDGNKRVAWVACRTFLALNGWTLPGLMEEKYVMMLGLAEGSVAEADFAAWLRRRMVRSAG